MKWTGDSNTDLRLSLMDDSESVIFGQVIKNNEGGWTAFDYHRGATDRLMSSYFVESAKLAVELAQKIPAEGAGVEAI